MNFCYFHQEKEAMGKCNGCDKWICSKDYNLIDEKIDEKKQWIDKESYKGIRKRRSKRLEKVEYFSPVIYCPICYNHKLGIKDEKLISDPDHQLIKRKLLMCFQCGALLKLNDKFCADCGDSTLDEIEAIQDPSGGIRSSKRLK